MKIRFFAAVFAAIAVLALSSAPAAQAKPAHKGMKAHTHQSQSSRHTARRVVRSRSATLARASSSVPRKGFVPGIGEVLFGGPDGPPSGGAYTLHPTGDPSIGYFPALWAAQRRGDCVTDDGYGRFSPCGDSR